MSQTISSGVQPLSPRQRQTVFTLWIAYAVFYFGRVNISPVLPALATSLAVGRAEVGAIGTAFFWIYAIGQFVNGQLGAHFSPRRIIAVGIITIGIVNVAFSVQSSLWIMIVLWGINGFAQSMGWPPMLRIIAERLDSQQARHVSTILPLSYVVGTVVTWTLIGTITSSGRWQIAFWLPGVTMFLLLAFWWHANIDAPRTSSHSLQWLAIASELRRIWFVLLTAIFTGFVFFGLIIWLPTYISDTEVVSETMTGFIAASLQLIGIPGLFFARFLITRWNKVLVAMSVLLGLAGTGLVAAAFVPTVWGLVALGLTASTITGAGGLLIGTIPLMVASHGRTSAISGSVNAMSNFGGGLSGFLIGAIVEAQGWPAAFLIWASANYAAALLIWFNRAKDSV